jgi:hypothetical protein
LVGSVVSSAFGEEVVGSSVGEEDVGFKVGCSVGVKVFAAADDPEVIVSFVVFWFN